MNAKHTPGPWSIVHERHEDPEARSYEITSELGHGSTHAEAFAATHEEALANARLIAAAPAMFAALEETLRALEAHLDESTRDHGLGHRSMLCPCHENEVTRARAAIAAATLDATPSAKGEK